MNKMIDLLDVLYEFKKYFKAHITDDLNYILNLDKNLQGDALTTLKEKYADYLEKLLDSCEWENPIEAVREEYKKEFCDSYVESTFKEYTEELNVFMRKLRRENKKDI